MKAAVRAQFDLGQEWDDGKTLREHLMAAEAATGRTPDRLRTPAIPDCFERHLAVWLALHERRQVGMGGLQPIGWPDLAAYCSELKAFCRRRGATYALMNSGERIEPFILNYLRRIGLLR